MKTRLRPRYLLLAGLPALALLAGNCQTVADALTPSLPAATQEGKDTFGCLLDGAVWLPNRKHTLDTILEGDVSGNTLFSLKAEDNYTPANFYLSVADAAGIRAGTTYALGPDFSASFYTFKGSTSAEYLPGAGDQGTLTITKFEPFSRTSTVAGQTGTVRGAIVSGTFAFTASSSTGQRITVREGRFDVNAYQ